ncbi:unannotated protein [freshwater metagenome]|uniref:Unannotated protein n=1 Tax=freshwater metagenome TaxID=449393 RepID=A0A6J6RFJ0_9ZZZZ|nr:hypothetical protein [Actinomycetota bacterium]
MNENEQSGVDFNASDQGSDPILDATSEAAIDALLSNAQFITPPPGPVADRFTAMLAIEVAKQEKELQYQAFKAAELARHEATVAADAARAANPFDPSDLIKEDDGAQIIAFKPRAKWIAPVSIAAALVLVAGVGIGVTNGNLFSSNSSSSVPLASDIPTEEPSAEPTATDAPTTAPSKKPSSKPSSDESLADQGATDTGALLSRGSTGKTVPIVELFSGLAYDESLSEIVDYIGPESAVGGLGDLSSGTAACIKSNGLAKYVAAVDNGTYRGKDVTAVFSPLKKGGFRITLLNSRCGKMAILSIK